MGALRERMVKQIRLRHLSPRTEETYVWAVAGLAKHYNIAPDKLTAERVQDYLLYLYQDRKLAWSTCNVVYSALRFFYETVLNRPEIGFQIPSRKKETRIGAPLTKEEVKRIILSVTNLKHRTLLMTVYGAGLRVGEAVRLMPHHIECSRMLIRVEQGKGRKDRYTILPDSVKEILRPYSTKYKPGKWLFFGRDRNRPLPVRTAQKIYYHAKERTGITKGKGIHDLRHAFATHLLESGHDIFMIKRLLGHRAISTTVRYLYVSPARIGEVISPADTIERDGVLPS